jgi:flagellar basal-body rod protein FlgB
MADLFLDTTSVVLAKVLDGSARRQRVLADNIANADTPGYTRQDLPFDAQLREVINRPGLAHAARAAEVEEIPLHTHPDYDSPRRLDGNNVNIEREMVGVAKNTLQYETAIQMLSMKFRALKSAIHEGKR